MPVTDIIEMVAGLLTKITTTNDRQHEHLHRQIPPPEGTAGLSQQTNSVLAFHGKNVPQISILSYLSRIHKYCPTTYEVFLSLLVYFDRMTERVNSGPMQSLRRRSQQQQQQQQQQDPHAPATSRDRAGSETTLVEDTNMEGSQGQDPTPTPPDSGSLGRPAEPRRSASAQGSPPSPPDVPMEGDNYNLSHFFVVDSYNIHRLVIAGVTCASKFFSDIFYTNSRYAKVRPEAPLHLKFRSGADPFPRSVASRSPSSITWSCSSSCSTTSGCPCRWRRSRPTARCWSSSTHVRWLRSKSRSSDEVDGPGTARPHARCPNTFSCPFRSDSRAPEPAAAHDGRVAVMCCGGCSSRPPRPRQIF
ncbi:MAG: hypothetical protein INR71_07130 [Terriglobus roseus]|nr:hypothetical protein [Terriglobus roseus]